MRIRKKKFYIKSENKVILPFGQEIIESSWNWNGFTKADFILRTNKVKNHLKNE